MKGAGGGTEYKSDVEAYQSDLGLPEDTEPEDEDAGATHKCSCFYP
jgi:hypothetical protein